MQPRPADNAMVVMGLVPIEFGQNSENALNDIKKMDHVL